jgi:hypothetical protein
MVCPLAVGLAVVLVRRLSGYDLDGDLSWISDNGWTSVAPPPV